MGTKDRLAALKANAVYPSDQENVVIMVAGSDEKQESLQIFQSDIDKLKNFLSIMEIDINKIGKLYSTDLNNYKSTQENKFIIEELMNDVRSNSSKVRNKLKELDDELEKLKKKNGSSAEFRIKKNLHSFVLNKFIHLMTKYNDIQVEHREKCKNKIQIELEITGHKVSSEKLDDMIESGELEVFTQNYKIENQKIKEAIDDLKTRRNELRKIEASIKQIHQMFVEMAQLIEHQGSLVDRIEHHVINAKEYAEEGARQTKEALEHHRSLLKKKFCCYSVLVVFAIIFVLYTIWELK